MANVEYEVKGKLAYITLNRPEKLNAITLPMFDEIVSTCRRYNEDPDVWVAILSGKGRAFCPGIDLTEQKPGLTFNVDEVYFSILGVKKPLIAAVHGYCLAQGAGIAFCCDIRVAAEGTKFGWPQVKRGMSSISGPSFAAHHLPLNYAYEYLFTGELFDAQEAYRFRKEYLPLRRRESRFGEGNNLHLVIIITTMYFVLGLLLVLLTSLLVNVYSPWFST